MDIYKDLQSAYGNHFQDLFTKLMKQKYGFNYQQTSTYSSYGDMKIDGILNFSIGFAIYAPEIYKEDNVITKIKSDFKGFIQHKQNGSWKNINKLFFVIKRERSGVTPRVFDTIAGFNNEFPVNIITMDDIEIIAKGYLPFSNDGVLLEKFKTDMLGFMQYAIDTDFCAEPFQISFIDDIEIMIHKWNNVQYFFNNEELEDLKKQILKVFCDLYKYINEPYTRLLSDGRVLFNNTSYESGERLREEMQPNVSKLRKEMGELLIRLIGYGDN